MKENYPWNENKDCTPHVIINVYYFHLVFYFIVLYIYCWVVSSSTERQFVYKENESWIISDIVEYGKYYTVDVDGDRNSRCLPAVDRIRNWTELDVGFLYA